MENRPTMISPSRTVSLVTALFALTALPFATGCAADNEPGEDDDANVATQSQPLIVVDFAAACAKKGKVYSPETGTCVAPIPKPGEPGIAPSVCKTGEELVGIYCYPKGVVPRPVGYEAGCPAGTVKYGSQCVSAIEPTDCDPQYTVSRLGPNGYYCAPNADLSLKIGETVIESLFTLFFGK